MTIKTLSQGKSIIWFKVGFKKRQEKIRFSWLILPLQTCLEPNTQTHHLLPLYCLFVCFLLVSWFQSWVIPYSTQCLKTNGSKSLMWTSFILEFQLFHILLVLYLVNILWACPSISSLLPKILSLTQVSIHYASSSIQTQNIHTWKGSSWMKSLLLSPLFSELCSVVLTASSSWAVLLFKSLLYNHLYLFFLGVKLPTLSCALSTLLWTLLFSILCLFND